MTTKYSDSLLGTDARNKLMDGAKQVYDHVASTLGPRGKYNVIHKGYDTEILQDGVRVANEINPKNKHENAGVSILRQAARQTVKEVGDGTTVTVILSYAIAYEAMKLVESGVHPMTIIPGLEKGCNLLIEQIKKQSSEVKTRDQKINVATISSKDKLLGELVGDTLDKSGLDGVVTVEQIIGSEDFVDHQEGLQINSGYKHQLFVTNSEDSTATINKARVLVTDHTLDNMYDLVPFMDDVVKDHEERNLVVICQDMTGYVLATFLDNKLKGQLNTLAIKAPSVKQTETLQDIAIMLGATFISKETVKDLKTIKFEDLGYAQQVTSTRDATVFVSGGGDDKAIKDRIKAIRKQIEEETVEFEQQKLRERLARLTGGVFVVNVGGATEVEAREKKERAIDAVEATKAAIRGGVVPGGETIYLGIDDCLKPTNEGEEYAYRILKKSLYAPFNRLLENAGLNPGEYREKLKGLDLGMGVEVKSGNVENLVEKGIVDPALASQVALKNAVSVASSIIGSEGVIAEVVEES